MVQHVVARILEFLEDNSSIKKGTILSIWDSMYLKLLNPLITPSTRITASLIRLSKSPITFPPKTVWKPDISQVEVSEC